MNMSILDLILLAGILLALVLAIGSVRRSRKQGKSCGCSCSGCTANCQNRK